MIEKFCNCKIIYCTEEEYDALPTANTIKFQSGGRSMAVIHDKREDIEENFWEKYNEKKKELESLRDFLEKTEARLDNESFIKKAPKDIIDKEYKKWWDCMNKITFTANRCLDDIQDRIDLLKQIK